jgi:membrane associated rhomboid family serine protease
MSEPFTLSLCLITVGISCWAFQRQTLRDALLFRPESILRDKEWYRVLTSALLHADGRHLAFNMISLYLFGINVEADFGGPVLVGIYLASVAGGSLLSLYIHRFHDYSALGASGGVCGVMFASIFLIPGMNVNFLFLPIGIPGPLYAVCYLVWTFYSLRRGTGNVAHDAHFGGALVGLVLAAIIAPRSCLASPGLFIGCFAFAAACLYALSRDPMGISGSFLSLRKPEPGNDLRSMEYDEAIERKKERDEVDRILDKIAAKGIGSISRKERATLDRMSAKAKK